MIKRSSAVSVPPKKKGQIETNADAIRNMTDEELAMFLCKVKADYQRADHEYPSEDACEDWEEWLQAEVKEGNSHENT